MNSYKLLTPGPLTTTDTVKQVMLFDHCTWDDDYKQITQTIRRTLLALGHVSEPEYTAVLMQGSGTFGVESVLTSVIGREDKLLIAANGAYGLRMAEICRHAGIAYTLYEQDNHKRPQADVVAKYLAEDLAITHVSMVHGETTSGHPQRCGGCGPGGKGRRQDLPCGRHVHLRRRGHPGGWLGH